MRHLTLILVFALIGCKTTSNQPLTLNKTPEQIAQANPIELCLDNQKFALPEVEKAIKKRKINCNKELSGAYSQMVSSFSNAELCLGWMDASDKLALSEINKEVKKRDVDCSSIIAAKSQQDQVLAMERARKQAAFNAINQSIQNQQAINAMNRTRYTNCNAFGCTTY